MLVGQRLFDGVSSFAELEARIASLPTERERGAALEIFAEAWLATQRIPQAREVWPGSSAPPSLQQRLRLPLKDMGVDGVFEAVAGEPTCYQVKFRIGRPALSWRELSTFFGLADAGCGRLVFTNCDEIASVAEDRPGVVFVRGSDLDRLTPDDFRVIEAWLSGRLSGDVGAWRRRLRIIAFKEPVKGRPVIVNFDRMLIEQEGAGILNWAVMGAAQVLADKRAGRTRPLSAAQHERIETLLGQSDSMLLFLELRVEKQPGEVLEKNDLLEAYADFCGEQVWEPLPELAARKELNNRMLELFGAVERKSAGSGHNQRGYSNVAMKAARTGDAEVQP